MFGPQFPFDFAIRVDQLIVGNLKGGVSAKLLQDYLREVADELDDPVKNFLDDGVDNAR